MKVLLLEAGGDDQAPSIRDPGVWYTNLGTDRDRGDQSTPQRHLNGRSLKLSMGKALGGGSGRPGMELGARAGDLQAH
ncbi:hypothetical protein [Massilia niastensis]|uniref:hypothetical protein n=1 Tax=Massilia niastensis TaxID=544911 RepID=UPI0035305DED